jgi:hypothetical protein
MRADPWPSLHAPPSQKMCDGCLQPVTPTPMHQTRCPNILPLAGHVYICVFVQFIVIFYLTSYNEDCLQIMKAARLQQKASRFLLKLIKI